MKMDRCRENWTFILRHDGRTAVCKHDGQRGGGTNDVTNDETPEVVGLAGPVGADSF